MKSKSLVTVILLLSSGTALADQQIATVQVRPWRATRWRFPAATPPRPADRVENLLQINDRSQTHGLSNKLMAAAAAACDASVAAIVVTRPAPAGR
jgi:hypothetical protein